MRLAHIKLAGFKSFADQTTIPISAALTGVVGPNGCGKSNVIDAIRWVMGERSASALRGEGMNDVIFNGSSTRAGTDRASVELQFHSAQLPSDSPWSAFHDISIKRVIYRNQTSDYFILNQKVRRKDVADLFLGTGLGPRSYAIIEQGMVSRIIESNPRELRMFLEEAAGVSKYKERRHETENRMEYARANLNRVEDIRVEVVAQVDRLRVQAEIAQQYQTLQQAYSADQRLVAVMQWLASLNERKKAYQQYLDEQTTMEVKQSEIAAIDRQQAEKEATWESSRDLLEEAQSDLMAYNAQVAELEQDLRLGTQQKGHLEQGLNKLTSRIQQLTEQDLRLEEEATIHLEQKESQQSERLAAETEFQEQLQAFYDTEKVLLDIRQQTDQSRDEATRQLSQTSAKTAEVKNIFERLEDNRSRHEAIIQSLQALDDESEASETKNSITAISPYQDQLAEAQAKNEECREQAIVADEALMEAESEAQQVHQTLAELRPQESALTARIQTLEQQLSAASQHQEALPEWLKNHQMLPSEPLEEVISIEGQWEHAVAVVLADWLGVRSLPAWQNIRDIAENVPPIGRLLIGRSLIKDNQVSADAKPPAPKPGTLAEHISVSDPSFSTWLVTHLNRYRLSENWQEALAKRHLLANDEFWVSPNGVVVGAFHVHFPGDGGVRAMHLENRHALEQSLIEQQTIAETIQKHLAYQEQSNKKCLRLREKKEALEYEQEQISKDHQELANQEREWQFQQQSVKEKTDWQRREWQQQQQTLTHDEQILLEKQAQNAGIVEVAKTAQSKIATKLSALQEECERLEDAVREQRESMRNQELAVQRLQHQVDQANSDLLRVEKQQKNNQQLIVDTNEQLEQTHSDINSLPQVEEVDQSLQEMLTLKQTQEGLVVTLRQQSEAKFAEQKQVGASRQKNERQAADAREKMNKHQLTMQACDLHSQQYREHYVRHGGELQALAEMDVPAEIIAKGNGNEKSLSQLQSDINRRELAMKALEPVNLAAITELEHESARLAELAGQCLDLNTALTTLAAAISQIDQEMRSRMINVFDRVNVKFGELFRLIFGGGQAEIILTGEEILDAGVILKAQPLGKNNASIHLLSGGEKALTAIALVFAFFSLNPAPFCVLDEVDAPLDDANTRRFTELIRDMSAETQFLVISHNRITMEAMQTLIGVTMRDPGVSKVVSVDLLNVLASVDKAVATANDSR